MYIKRRFDSKTFGNLIIKRFKLFEIIKNTDSEEIFYLSTI